MQDFESTAGHKTELSCKQTPEMLFEMQKQTLDIFLEKNAISKEQYDKSLTTLKEQMNLK